MIKTSYTKILRKKIRNASSRSLRSVWVTLCTWAHHFTNARVKAHNVRKDKERSMKKVNFKWRLTGVLATFAIAAALAACGGGGGTSVGDKPFTGPDVVEVRGTLTTTTPTPVVAGASTTAITLTWGTTQGTPTLPTVVSTMSATALATTPNGNLTVQVPVGTSTFSFLNGPTTLATVSVTVSCATGTTLVGTTCTVPVLKYTDKVFAVWTGGYLYSVIKTGVEVVKNSTRYQSGALPLNNCGLKPKAETSGLIGVACKDSTGVYRKLLLDPIANEVRDDGDATPVDSEYVFLQAGSTIASARVTDGLFYADDAARWNLLFRSDATGAVTTIKAGTFEKDGDIKLILSYSN